jgi:hypothetical protein
MVRAQRPIPATQKVLIETLSHSYKKYPLYRDDVVVKGRDHTLWIKDPSFIK